MQWWIAFSEVVRNLGLVVGGAIGIYLAWLRVTAANQQAEAQRRQAEATARQADLGRHKLVTDLFQQAVGQLRDEKLEVRLFGIYTLRQIVEDYLDYKRPVIELLSAYVRDNPVKWGEGDPPVDIREIFNILGRTLEYDNDDGI